MGGRLVRTYTTYSTTARNPVPTPYAALRLPTTLQKVYSVRSCCDMNVECVLMHAHPSNVDSIWAHPTRRPPATPVDTVELLEGPVIDVNIHTLNGSHSPTSSTARVAVTAAPVVCAVCQGKRRAATAEVRVASWANLRTPLVDVSAAPSAEEVPSTRRDLPRSLRDRVPRARACA